MFMKIIIVLLITTVAAQAKGFFPPKESWPQHQQNHSRCLFNCSYPHWRNFFKNKCEHGSSQLECNGQ
jgi:hypothetical protein